MNSQECLNAKNKSEKIERYEFRYISFNDLTFFIELLDKVEDDREFVIQVVCHQIMTPEVSPTELSKIPNSELIKLARNLIKKEQYVFRYFTESTDEEFFNNFKEAIKKCYQNQFKNLHVPFESIAKSIKIFENFNIQYGGFIKQTTYITESIRTISEITEQIRKFNLVNIKSLKPFIEQYQLNARILSNVLVPQIRLWQKWIEQNKAIFDVYINFWKTFQERYKITEEEAVQVLKKYKWFVTPSLPIALVFEAVKIGKRRGNQRKAMNRIFINYFSANNFKNLENLVNKWKRNPFFKPRMKIFKDCVYVMKNADGKYNPANIVLPTLIAQIDGIRIEFMYKNGLSFRSKEWKEFFKSITPNQELLELANDIFLNILFQKSFPRKPLETPFTFNRHKIMHGEYLRYGRIDNVIRAFLILDFLATITDQNMEKSSKLNNIS